jgi:hypothetical protein
LTPGGSSVHLHTNSTQNTEDGTHVTVKEKQLEGKNWEVNWEVWAVPRLCELYRGFALHLRKKHGKTSVRVVEKCPEIQVAVVQYTFTHKQYTERNIHNNNNRTYITVTIEHT